VRSHCAAGVDPIGVRVTPGGTSTPNGTTTMKPLLLAEVLSPTLVLHQGTARQHHPCFSASLLQQVTASLASATSLAMLHYPT
jgi:hypothetical protein